MKKLADFGVQVKVIANIIAPVITRFELELASGIKVNKLSGLAKDLARSLLTQQVRVVELIPGKPYVGLEIPNKTRKIVRLKSVLMHKKFIISEPPLTIGLGSDTLRAHPKGIRSCKNTTSISLWYYRFWEVCWNKCYDY